MQWADVESLIEELQKIDGVIGVSKGRFFLSPGLTPTFQVRSIIAGRDFRIFLHSWIYAFEIRKFLCHIRIIMLELFHFCMLEHGRNLCLIW